MRVTGDGVWGEPADRDEVIRTLKRVPELGINLIDTADAYGPDVSEKLIREALSPYKGLVIATKGGLTRPGPGKWVPLGRPEYLISQAEKSLEKLGVAQIDLWQLHRIDSECSAQRAIRCDQNATRSQDHPLRGLERSQHRRHRSRFEGVQGRNRSEPLQYHQPQ